MSYTVSTLLLRNLHDVFGEIDPVRRRAAIDEIFHEDAAFHEPTALQNRRVAANANRPQRLDIATPRTHIWLAT